jgi:hypothetical protein
MTTAAVIGSRRRRNLHQNVQKDSQSESGQIILSYEMRSLSESDQRVIKMIENETSVKILALEVPNNIVS